MAATITKGGDTIEPLLILGYEVEQESTNVHHKIIGRPAGDQSLGADGLRTGSLPLLFATEAAAEAARAFHATPGVCTLTHPDVPSINMTYVREGRMRVRLDEDTRSAWVLEVGFREVTA